MLCAWIATCFFIGFSLQMNLVLVNGLSLSDCEDDEFKLNNENQCRRCPACPAGQEYTNHCGYEEINGRISRPGKECEDCRSGSYKSSKSTNICDRCTATRCQKNAEMIHPCNKTHDIKCKCKKGFYTASDGACVPCSPCCGSIAIYAKKFVEKECDEAGMESCSCRALQGCNDKRDCYRASLISTKEPFRTSPSSPTIKSTTRKPDKNHRTLAVTTQIAPRRRKTVNPGLQQQKDEKKEEKEQSFATGWLVATVIGIVLVLAVLFHMLKHFKTILKRLKLLLKPSEQVVEEDASHSVITVEERFETPARPVATNYAERIIPAEEEMESQSDHNQQNLAILHRCAISASDLEEFDDPWVYRDSIETGAVQMTPIRWPLTRAEVALNPGYGEYIKILRNEDEPGDDGLSTQGNNSGSLQQLDEEITNESLPPPQTQDKKELLKVKLDNKLGQEHSDGEEPSTSIPATASGGNTVVIATGQHRGGVIGTDEFVTNVFSKGKQDKVSSDGKRRKRKAGKKRPPDDYSMDSEDTLQCTCGCSYRPYLREEKLCHCTDCVPQPTDELYDIIERRCLRAEICKELNKEGVSNWRDLCTYIRIDKDITGIEKEQNPAEVVLNKLKTSRPRLNLKDFKTILHRIKRQDIMKMIMYHHVKCMLCRRNSFDGSLVNVHTVSVADPSTTWMASKLSS